MTALATTEQKRQLTAREAQTLVQAKQNLTFMLGGEMFSINILCIKEIIWYADLTEVPMMPA